MRIPPNPPPNPSGSPGQPPQTKQQMADAIQRMLQQLFGDNAAQSPDSGSSSYSKDLMDLIHKFHSAKNWQEAERLYQEIMMKLQEGDPGGSSQTPPPSGL